MIAQPVVGASGQPQGVVVAQLDPAVLADLLKPADTATMLAVDAQRQLVYSQHDG